VGCVNHTGSGAPKDDVVGRQEIGATGVLLVERENPVSKMPVCFPKVLLPSSSTHPVTSSPPLLLLSVVVFSAQGSNSRSSRCGCGRCRRPGRPAAGRGPCSSRRGNCVDEGPVSSSCPCSASASYDPRLRGKSCSFAIALAASIAPDQASRGSVVLENRFLPHLD
jgi:hypothetical protein